MKLLLVITCLALSFAVNVGISIYGWGLTPMNWWWIGGGFTFAMFLNLLTMLLRDMK